ncbi:MAG: hypothetical protein ABF975_01465 [Liquorilactobacillus hordei]|uniref:hypothetical protein n=1 Tax=Liquorilactobacillus hordei TaxID=468911 RepID=UPI0039E92821
MLTQSDAAIAAWRATERTLDAKVSITDSNGNITDYGTTDVTSIAYDSGAFSGDTFSIGSTYENNMIVTFAHLVEGLQQGYKVTAKIGIKLPDGTYEYCPLGVFVISDDISMDRNNDITTIKCYDQFCAMEGTYTSALTYPAKVVDVIAEIANKAGVVLNTGDIAKLPTQADIASAITGQTYRVAIGWIAQFYGGFALFDRDGKLTIRTTASPDYILDPSQYEQSGLTKNEATYKIGGMSVSVTATTTDSTGESSETTSTLTAGSTSGSQIELTNNVMTQDRLGIIWSTIKDITFYPYSVTWFGNPAIEAGDWLTLKDTAGNAFNVPNSSYTMTFDGGLTATSKADQTSTSSSSYSYSGTLSQTVKQLAGRQGATGNYIYGEDVTENPTDAKIGDQWYKKNGNKTELWLYKKQSDGTVKWDLIVSDLTSVEITAKVNTAMADVDTAKQDVQTAVDTANTSIAQSGLAITNAQNAADTATAVQQQVIALKGGSTLTIAELENGLSTKVSSDDFDSYRTQTDSALVDKVSSADFTSYRTQTDAAIQDRITTIDAQTLVTTTANAWQANLTTLQTQVNNSAVGTNLLLKTGSPVTLIGTGGVNQTVFGYLLADGLNASQLAIKYGGTYVISYDWSVSGPYPSGFIGAQFNNVPWGIGDKVEVTNSKSSGHNVKTFGLSTSSSNVATGIGFRADQLVGTLTISNVKIEKGSLPTDYSANPADNATNVALTAVNTSLTSAINLRVQKNDVINQINVSSEGILIDGKKVHITGTTTIDNAVIKSAMIDSLSASKLTAGIIDASVISVINLNANNISTGTLTGVTFHQSSTNSDTWIDDDGISNYNNTNSYVRIRNGNISAYNSSGQGMFMDSGALYLTTYNLWENNGKGGTPQYGSVNINSDLFSSGGIAINGNNGYAIRTQNSDISSLSTNPWTSNRPNGSFIGGTQDGTTMMVGHGTSFISGGTRYGEATYGLPCMAFLSVGGRLDKNGAINGGDGADVWMEGYQIQIQSNNENINLSAKGNVVVERGGFIATDGGSHIRNTQIDNELWVNGNFSVSGTKNAVVETSVGWININAYETAEYYFGDLGKVNTGSGSKVKIVMDSLFLETVNTKVDYHVFVSSYGNGYAWVSEQGPDYFVIESNVPNLEISYEVKAKRLGYENTRLEVNTQIEEMRKEVA